MKSNCGGWGLAGLLNICELCGGLCHFKGRLFCFLKFEGDIGFKWLFHIFFNKHKNFFIIKLKHSSQSYGLTGLTVINTLFAAGVK